jgi:hypothetical protein
MKSILDITVSGYSNYMDNKPINVNLKLFLTSDKYQKEVEQIRTLTDKGQRDKIKSTLPAITPSGTFANSRKDENLIKHSGFICIDIDLKGNENVNNYTDLKTELCKIPFVAFCGLSVSGTGYFVLIPIKEHQHHRDYFNTLFSAFQDMNITIDKSCVNVSRLRGYSYDKDCFINENAKVWDYLPRTKEVKPQATKTSQKSDNYYFDKCMNIIQTNKIDITTNYDNWFILLGCLANTFGENGRQYAHIISQYHPNYKTSETDFYYNKVLKSDSKKRDISTFFKFCKEYGISYKDEINNNTVDYKEIYIKNLIRLQWTNLDKKAWILEYENNKELKSIVLNNIEWLCSTFNKKYNMNIADNEYYNI